MFAATVSSSATATHSTCSLHQAFTNVSNLFTLPVYCVCVYADRSSGQWEIIRNNINQMKRVGQSAVDEQSPSPHGMI
jgi:hypothetical protein